MLVDWLNFFWSQGEWQESKSRKKKQAAQQSTDPDENNGETCEEDDGWKESRLVSSLYMKNN